MEVLPIFLLSLLILTSTCFGDPTTVRVPIEYRVTDTDSGFEKTMLVTAYGGGVVDKGSGELFYKADNTSVPTWLIIKFWIKNTDSKTKKLCFPVIVSPAYENIQLQLTRSRYDTVYKGELYGNHLFLDADIELDSSQMEELLNNPSDFSPITDASCYLPIAPDERREIVFNVKFENMSAWDDNYTRFLDIFNYATYLGDCLDNNSVVINGTGCIKFITGESSKTPFSHAEIIADGCIWEEDCVMCGDGVCASNETTPSCPEDCTVCGDGVCGHREWCDDCPSDCGECVFGLRVEPPNRKVDSMSYYDWAYIAIGAAAVILIAIIPFLLRRKR